MATKKARGYVSKAIKTGMKHGKGQKQAVAYALGKARKKGYKVGAK